MVGRDKALEGKGPYMLSISMEGAGGDRGLLGMVLIIDGAGFPDEWREVAIPGPADLDAALLFFERQIAGDETEEFWEEERMHPDLSLLLKVVMNGRERDRGMNVEIAFWKKKKREGKERKENED